jgi:hypothetical protein
MGISVLVPGEADLVAGEDGQVGERATWCSSRPCSGTPASKRPDLHPAHRRRRPGRRRQHHRQLLTTRPRRMSCVHGGCRTPGLSCSRLTLPLPVASGVLSRHRLPPGGSVAWSDHGDRSRAGPEDSRGQYAAHDPPRHRGRPIRRLRGRRHPWKSSAAMGGRSCRSRGRSRRIRLARPLPALDRARVDTTGLTLSRPAAHCGLWIGPGHGCAGCPGLPARRNSALETERVRHSRRRARSAWPRSWRTQAGSCPQRPRARPPAEGHERRG